MLGTEPVFKVAHMFMFSQPFHSEANLEVVNVVSPSEPVEKRLENKHSSEPCFPVVLSNMPD